MAVNLNNIEPQRPLVGELVSETSDFIADLTGQVQGGFSALDLAHDRFNSGAISVLGMSSCLSVVIGPVRALHGVKQIKLSQQLKDNWGEIHGYLKTAQGGIQTVAGAAFIPAAALITALFFTSSKVMIVAARVLSVIGGALLAVVSAISMIASSFSLYHAVLIRRIIETATENLTPEEALVAVRAEIVSERFHFERALGADLVEEILVAEPEKAQEVLDKAISAASKEIGLQALNIFLYTSAIVLTIAALAISGPFAPIIIAAIGTVLGLAFLVLDLQGMSEEMSNPVGKLDTAWVYLSAIFSAALIVGAFLVESNPYVIAIIAFMALLLVLVHVACMIRVHSAE